MKRYTQIALILLLALALAAAWGLWKVQRMATSRVGIAGETIFSLKPGTGRDALGVELYQQKLIMQPRVFQWLLRMKPELSHFKAGSYRLTPDMTVEDMMKRLVSGKEAQFSIRLVEGQRVGDWLKTLRHTPYIKHTLKNDDYRTLARALGLSGAEAVEGWFYPDTWSYTAGTTDIAILRRAHDRMVRTLQRLWDERRDGLPYKDQNQWLTLASIIEKETAVADERPQVASVFINRLRIGMRLQTDPTVIYGMGNSYQGRITRSALETPTPYNTYIISGLPPTPIAVPGLSSLKAALNPAKTAWLYFVADGKGGHRFSTNMESHNRAVRDYLQVLKERNEG